MSDKTFAETQGVPPFDWNLFLARAARNEVTTQEWVQAQKLAGNWVTCACGNQCAIIPRVPTQHSEVSLHRFDVPYTGGGPLDNQLDELGMLFMSAIDDKDVSAAKLILCDIECRSAVLIENELRKLHQPS